MKYLFLMFACVSIIVVAGDPNKQRKTFTRKESKVSLPSVIIHTLPVSAPAKKTHTPSRSTLVRAALPTIPSVQPPVAPANNSSFFNRSLRLTNLPSLIQPIAAVKDNSEEVDLDAARAFVAREVKTMRDFPAVLAAANAYTISDPVLGTLIRYNAVDAKGKVMHSRGNCADLPGARRRKSQKLQGGIPKKEIENKKLFVPSAKGSIAIETSKLKDITADVRRRIAERRYELSDDCVINL